MSLGEAIAIMLSTTSIMLSVATIILQLTSTKKD